MGYKITKGIAARVAYQAEDLYSSKDLDITDFTFSPKAKTMAFTLRLNRAEGETEDRYFVVPAEEFEALVASNIEAFQKVRGACFSYLLSKGEIPEGTDDWPVK
jgi:hypothetical protein